MKVIKRNGEEQDFLLDKIKNAVTKANKSVEPEHQMTDDQSAKVVETVQKKLEKFDSIKVEDIQDLVEAALVKHNKYDVAKAYIIYRDNKRKNKKYNEIEETVMAILDGSSAEARGDNANKHIDVNSSARDYIAGTVCKSLANKNLPKDIIEAHRKGLLHWHDSDYYGMHLHNCFDGETEFVTEFGIKKFNEFVDGQIVHVLDKDGVIREATVHEYELQPFNTVTLSTRNGYTQTVNCTADHRWILTDGSVTTNLKVGDKIALLRKADHPVNTVEQARAWTYGFMIGDGCDHSERYCQVRLCGSKNKYLSYFEKAGIFNGIKYTGDKDSIPYTKFFKKQEFLDGKSWKNMTAEQKVYLFEGLFAADHWNDAAITTADTRIAELIRECAPIAGYQISSEKEEYYSTNFKENAWHIIFRFLRPMTDGYGYTVKNITPKYADGRLQKTYCVEEPITHTFTLAHGVVTGNCDLINVFDMIAHGFMMGDTWIDPPKRFSTGCNLAAQIALIVSGSQYGGQTMSWSHLLQLIPSTKADCKVELLNLMSTLPKFVRLLCKPFYNKIIDKMVKRDIHIGIKTYQYQILCHHSSNGQTPFVSNNLCLREAQTPEDQKWLAFIIEEILKRRIKGVKDKSGHYVPPLFPKLLYWECEGLNVEKTDPYYYLTKLAAKCITLRMQPDINSEKKSREIKAGQIIPSMGCLSGDTLIKVKCDRDILTTTFECLWNNLSQIEETLPQFNIKDNPNLEINPKNLMIWDNKLEQFVNVSKLIRNVSDNWFNIEFTKETVIQPNEDFELN